MEPDKNSTERGTQDLGPRAQSTSAAASDLANDAKNLAGQVADRAKGVIGDQVVDQQTKSAQAIGQVADALRRTRENLGDAPTAPYVEKAAEIFERVSGSVRNATLDGVIRSTERFAQREPALFIGGAFALGFVAARFLKSAPRRATGQSTALLDSGDAHSRDDGGHNGH